MEVEDGLLGVGVQEGCDCHLDTIYLKMTLSLNKRNVRVLSITGLLMLLVFFLMQNENSILSPPSGYFSDDEDISSTSKGMINSNDNVKVGSGNNIKVGSDASVNAEIDRIKEQVGIPQNNLLKEPASNKDVASTSVKNNAAQRAIPGGSEIVEFDPAKEYAIIREIAPIIIFSKTFCPYCKKMKELLKKEYSFSPDFFSVELDKHTNGEALQKYIEAQTGQKTVPNFVVNGKSLGGFDSLEKLHKSGTLIETVQAASDYSVLVSSIKKPSNS